MVEVARAAARDGGADWLGVATLDEALALRAAGDTGRLLCWLARPGRGLRRRGRRATSTSRRTPSAELDEIARPPAAAPRPRAAQGRHRAVPRRRAARRLAGAGRGRAAPARRPAASRVTGIWSHFACSDEPDAPGQRRPGAALPRGAGRRPSGAGLRPEVRHLANSAAAILRPSSRFDLVRCGHRVVRPRPGARASRPTLGLRARDDRRAPAGDGQAGRGRRAASPTATPGSPTRDTTSAWCRSGTATACRAHAGNARRGLGRRRAPAGARPGLHGPVRRRPRRRPAPAPGDEVVLFGRATHGEPTAQDWAEAVRHHLLRDRHPHRRPAGPPPRRRRRHRHEHRPQGPRGRRRAPSASRPPAPPLGVARRRRVIAPARRRATRTPFGSLRSRRRSRSSPTTASRCTSRSTSSTGRAGRRRARRRTPTLTVVFVPRLRAQPRLLALPARGLPRPGAHGLLRPALARPLRPLDARARDHRAARPRPASSVLDDGRPRRAGRAGRPLDGRDDRSWRWPSSTPSCSATGSSASA